MSSPPFDDEAARHCDWRQEGPTIAQTFACEMGLATQCVANLPVPWEKGYLGWDETCPARDLYRRVKSVGNRPAVLFGITE
jgi:hypothetical protein